MKKRLFIIIISIFLLTALQTYSFASDLCTFNIFDNLVRSPTFDIIPNGDTILHTYIYTSLNANFDLTYYFGATSISTGILSVGSPVIISEKQVTLSNLTTPPLGIPWATHMIEILHNDPTGIDTDEEWSLSFYIDTAPPETLTMQIFNTDSLDVEVGMGNFTICPPKLDDIVDPQIVYEAQVITIELNAHDSGILILDHAPMPDFCFLEDDGVGTGRIICTPVEGDAGEYEITVYARLLEEPLLYYDSKTFTLEVIGINDPPDLVNPGDHSVFKEQSLNIPLNATDPEDDSMFFSSDTLPGFCDLSYDLSGTGSIDCNPQAYTPPGDYEITVRVTDDGEPNMFDEETFTLTVLRLPIDIVFVLDDSGSMLSNEKFEHMVEATQLLFDLFSSVKTPGPDDRWGMVFFKWVGGSDDTEVWQTLTPTISPPPNIRPDIYTNFTPIGLNLTPIGEGVLTGIAEFDDLSDSRRRIILLLSDGKENRGTPLLDTIPDLLEDNITLHAVGLGDGFYIEADKLQQAALETGGIFDNPEYPAELDDVFSSVFCDLTDKELAPVDTSGDVVINPGTTKAIFILTWDDPTVPLDFNLTHPNGIDVITPLSCPFGLDCFYSNPIAGDHHAFYIVEDIPDLGIQLAEVGEQTWSFSDIREADTIDTPPPASLMINEIVIEDLSVQTKFSVMPKIPYTGEPLILTAEIKEDGMPLLNAEVYADVNGPIESPNYFISTGIYNYTLANIITHDPASYQFLSLGYQPRYQNGLLSTTDLAHLVPNDIPGLQNLLTSVADAKDSTQKSFVIDQLFDLTGKSEFDKYSMRVILRDDGKEGDLYPQDGVYTYIFTNTSNEGSYRFSFTAKGYDSKGGRFARIKTLSKYILLSPEPDISEYDTSTKVEGNTVQAKITITPKDLNGISLGQFNNHRIEFKLSSGKIVDISEDLDGNYILIIEFDKDSYGPTITPVVSGISLNPIKIDYAPKRYPDRYFYLCYCHPCFSYYPWQIFTPYWMNMLTYPITYPPQFTFTQPIFGGLYSSGWNYPIPSYSGLAMGSGIFGFGPGSYYGYKTFGGYPFNTQNTFNYTLSPGVY